MHRSPLRTALLLLTSSWYAACGGDRVDVQPGGPGSGAATTGSSADAVTGAGGGGGDGSGGALQAGGGGAGGDTPTGSSTAGAGGSGGDPYASCGVTADCVGDQPTPCPENACESPDLFDACDGGDVPDAYVACVVWADLLRENVWATLVDCLRAASPDELCADSSDVADRCWDEVTANTCLNPDAAARCRTAADLCGGDEPLDVDRCTADLQPFTPTALDAYEACIGDRADDAPCDAIHADCLADLTAP